MKKIKVKNWRKYPFYKDLYFTIDNFIYCSHFEPERAGRYLKEMLCCANGIGCSVHELLSWHDRVANWSNV